MNNSSYRQRAVVVLIAVAFLAVVGVASYLYILPTLPSLPFEKSADLKTPDSAEQFVPKETAKQASLPPPLRNATSSIKTPPSKPKPAPALTLTRAGIIANANSQRKANGNLPALSENATLDAVAAARLADMFQKQYFAHVAPDGGSAETIAKTFNYEYLAIGENIALGEFAGDADLVAAWMASPGHRENILSPHYTQIGVAALEGVFEGKTVWIAAQIFAKPASACPAVDANLKADIDDAKDRLAQIQAQIQAKKADLDAMEPKYGSAYNQQVDEYNTLVRKYNTLLEQTRLQTNQYNAQVAAFNSCI